MTVRVGVVGFGTIGKRVADAIAKQKDMVLVGVAKTKPDYGALEALSKGYALYAPRDRIEAFKKVGIEVAGTIEDLVKEVDVVIDATPGGVGARNRALYEKLGVKAVFQGGEEPEVAEASFCALANFEEAWGKKFVRVVSCNTTAIARFVAALKLGGIGVKRVRVFIARRGADPREYKRGPINDFVLNPPAIPSHHARDVLTVVKDVDVVTAAIATPVTISHAHFVYAELSEPVARDEVLEVLRKTPRIALFSSERGFVSVAQVLEWARDIGRPRGDVPENIVFEDCLWVRGRELVAVMAVHQESIVIPENVDAVRAVAQSMEKWESIRETDLSLGLLVEGKVYG